MFIRFLLAILSIILVELVVEFILVKCKKGVKNENIKENDL